MLGTVRNVGRLLDLYDAVHTEWGVTEAAEALGTPIATMHALLASLVHVGLLQRTTSGRYRLGWRLYVLGSTLVKTTMFRSESRGPMHQFVERYGETVNLGVLDSGRILYIQAVQGTHPVRVWPSEFEFPAHCTAAGKVLLAHQTPTNLASCLRASGELPSRTARSITSLAALEQELAAIRSNGYAYSLGESFNDINAIAAPVRDNSSAVVAAVAVVVPEYRFQKLEATYRYGILGLARQISQNLGCVQNASRTRGKPCPRQELAAIPATQ